MLSYSASLPALWGCVLIEFLLLLYKDLTLVCLFWQDLRQVGNISFIVDNIKSTLDGKSALHVFGMEYLK